MKNTTIILLFLILFSCSNSKQQKETKEVSEIDIVETPEYESEDKLKIEPYDYDTILKNGFHLSYRIYKDTIENEVLQSLTLVKGNHDIRVLNETSYPMLHKNLGYIGVDYGNSFVFVQSFGSGNPNYIQLINKETGEEIKNGTWVDVNEKEKILLYISDIHEDTEQLKIYDLLKNKETIVKDFKESKCVKEMIGGLRNCVEIDTVTNNEIVLKIETEDEKIIRKYNR